MSSLARRSLRTTVAAAGLAAIGVGIAGPAVAAPAVPELPGGPEALTGPMTGGLPAPSTEGVIVPGVANIERPSIGTVGPELPALDAFELPDMSDLAFGALPIAAQTPTPPHAPQPPQAPQTDAVDGAATVDPDQVNGPGADPLGGGSNHVGAMQGLDAAAEFAEIFQRAADGEPATEGNEIG